MTSAAVTLGIATPTLVYALMLRRRPASPASTTEMWPRHVPALVKDRAANVVPMRAP
jgi:hypothetical protein